MARAVAKGDRPGARPVTSHSPTLRTTAVLHYPPPPQPQSYGYAPPQSCTTHHHRSRTTHRRRSHSPTATHRRSPAPPTTTAAAVLRLRTIAVLRHPPPQTQAHVGCLDSIGVLACRIQRTLQTGVDIVIDQ